MSLADTFSAGLLAMDSVTKPVQELIRIRPWISEDAFGKPTYGATRKHRAVVDRNVREMRMGDGRVIAVTASVTFLKPFPNIGAVGRQEPIDTRDKLYLQDDTTGPIVAIRGSIRPDAGTRYFLQVGLG